MCSLCSLLKRNLVFNTKKHITQNRFREEEEIRNTSYLCLCIRYSNVCSSLFVSVAITLFRVADKRKISIGETPQGLVRRKLHSRPSPLVFCIPHHVTGFRKSTRNTRALDRARNFHLNPSLCA